MGFFSKGDNWLNNPRFDNKRVSKLGALIE
jgi:hypothetical protein